MGRPRTALGCENPRPPLDLESTPRGESPAGGQRRGLPVAVPGSKNRHDSFKSLPVACLAIDITRIALGMAAPLVKARWTISYASTTYREYFQHRQWGIGLVAAPIHRFLDPEFRPRAQWVHAAGREEYLADPFGLVHNGRLRVLCELYRRETMRGAFVAFDWP